MNKLIIPEIYQSKLDYLTYKYKNYQIISKNQPYFSVEKSFFNTNEIEPILYYKNDNCNITNKYTITTYQNSLESNIIVPDDLLVSTTVLSQVSNIEINNVKSKQSVLTTVKKPVFREIDKIMSIPGIGKVQAQNLFEQYGSLLEIMTLIRNGTELGLKGLQFLLE